MSPTSNANSLPLAQMLPNFGASNTILRASARRKRSGLSALPKNKAPHPRARIVMVPAMPLISVFDSGTGGAVLFAAAYKIISKCRIPNNNPKASALLSNHYWNTSAMSATRPICGARWRYFYSKPSKTPWTTSTLTGPCTTCTASTPSLQPCSAGDQEPMYDRILSPNEGGVRVFLFPLRGGGKVGMRYEVGGMRCGRAQAPAPKALPHIIPYKSSHIISIQWL